ncbi:hypothetical protein [Pontibacter sp. G13]|uniref:hypothetical protein n=1 Tax=Pontibacter sp. G13 TaxID=3074898 RepID=UPI00288C0D4E|nr:hypothetical protein [Pontibacter sp. G13]WNJ17893.1 hypothetical protein RJD25_23820 [Pontibacter sp. G13]
MMTKLIPLFIGLCLISFSCSNRTGNDKPREELNFGDLVAIDKIDHVEMSNHSGTFNLTNKQIEKIKAELSEMVYDPNISVKVGAKNIELTIDQKIYTLSSATNGGYIEVHKDIVTKNKHFIGPSDWLYFRTGEVNFDNYKNNNQ